MRIPQRGLAREASSCARTAAPLRRAHAKCASGPIRVESCSQELNERNEKTETMTCCDAQRAKRLRGDHQAPRCNGALRAACKNGETSARVVARSLSRRGTSVSSLDLRHLRSILVSRQVPRSHVLLREIVGVPGSAASGRATRGAGKPCARTPSRELGTPKAERLHFGSVPRRDREKDR
jgi:hypothetical protein